MVCMCTYVCNVKEKYLFTFNYIYKKIYVKNHKNLIILITYWKNGKNGMNIEKECFCQHISLYTFYFKTVSILLKYFFQKVNHYKD